MKKQTLLFILFLCVICFSACRQVNKLPDDTDKPNITESDINVSDVTDDCVKVCWDDEELVMIRIFKNGEAELTFALDHWAEKYDIFNYTEQNYPHVELPLYGNPIIGPNGVVNGIKDACIGKITALDLVQREEFIVPSVIFLMEDGTLEWVKADPFAAGMPFSFGRLPWLKNIVSLSYEQENGGAGDMTIYATDADGLRYDVRLLCKLQNIFDGQWISIYESSAYSLFLTLTEDGEVTLMKGWDENEPIAVYKGTYEISLADNPPDSQRSGIISFDLSLDWAENDLPSEISGAYFIDAPYDYVWGICLGLSISDGDLLESDIEHYKFWQSYTRTGITDKYSFPISDLSDEEFIDFLLSNVPEAYERVKVMRNPLEVIIPGDITELPDEGICRNIWLVANSDENDHIDLIILYTISNYGSIYEYDLAGDAWIFINNPFAVG